MGNGKDDAILGDKKDVWAEPDTKKKKRTRGTPQDKKTKIEERQRAHPERWYQGLLGRATIALEDRDRSIRSSINKALGKKK